ncbi:Gibberellin-regulated protein 8 [Ananas comosus]|uniref:Gibberellin-regulated protein 8 n=1 Tax=Ananas comosus TaxID=4615 RepID=A0A199V316_ANACO|nr:Gibberellin-regulated protein 8 [Ananas comosus]
MKLFSFSLALMMLLLASAYLQTFINASEWCEGKCSERCSKAGARRRCVEYCNLCCEECNCVPSGTAGNKAECPCYRDKRNSKEWEISPN